MSYRQRVAFGIMFVAATVLSHSGSAATVSFTGTELVGASGVSFPTSAPTVSGSSIVFGPNSTPFAKLVAIDLSAIGLVPATTHPVQLTVAMNLTRLPCANIPDACDGAVTDWDPTVLLLDDAHHMVGAQLNDRPGEVLAEEYQDVGVAGQRLIHTTVIDSIAYPDIGNSIDVRLDYLLSTAASNVTVTVPGDSATFQAVQTLHTPGFFQVVLMRDNDPGEQYQLNSVSVSTLSAVPEPSGILLALCGLLALAFRKKHAWRRRKSSKSGAGAANT